MQKEADHHVEDMLKMALIKECSSHWSSPVVLVKKKDGTTRFCVDYRKMNNATVKDAYPLSRIYDSQLSDAKYNSTLDSNSGYWQVEVAEKTDNKLSSPLGKGFTVFMPFGLCYAPATFERLMELALRDLQW